VNSATSASVTLALVSALCLLSFAREDDCSYLDEEAEESVMFAKTKQVKGMSYFFALLSLFAGINRDVKLTFALMSIEDS